MRRLCSGAVWGRAASDISIRNGTSLATSPAIIAHPPGSCTINRSGGRSHPVAQGDRARTIQPEGAIRKAIPNAAAAWGAESRGDSTRSTQRNARVPCHPASNTMVMIKEAAVAIRPVRRLRLRAGMNPAQSNRSRNG